MPLLFVTAPTADHKALNRLMLHLRDWEDNSNEYHFTLATSKNAYDYQTTTATPPSLLGPLENGWKDDTLADIEGFVLDLDKSGHGEEQTKMFLCLDEKGLEEGNVILGERRWSKWEATGTDDEEMEEEEDFEPTKLDAYNKLRVAWAGAYSLWSTLDLAEMDFCDEQFEWGRVGWRRDADGWLEPGESGYDDVVPQDAAARRDAEIRKLGEKGLA